MRREARTHYERSLTAYKLAADVDQNDGYINSAATAYRSLGVQDKQERKWAGAIENYRNAIQFERRVTHLDENAKHVLLSDFTQSDTPRRAGGLMSWAASKAVGPRV